MNPLSFINRFLSQGLGLVISVSLFLTGPIAPFAEASERNRNDSFWKSRQLTARRRASVPEQCSNAFNIGKRPLPLKENSSPHWFEVNHYTPVFGPKSWRRGNTLVPFVTIIQDAHDNYAAQLALSRTLAEFAKKDKPLLVCVEGAWGPVDVRFLREIIPPTDREEAADRLLSRGLISGEEHRALLDDRINIIGVENKNLHRANSRSRSRVLANAGHVNQWLYELSKWRAQLIQSNLTPLQRELLDLRDSYDQGHLELRDYLQTLSRFWGPGQLPKKYKALTSYLQYSKLGNPEDMQAILRAFFSELGQNQIRTGRIELPKGTTPAALQEWWDSIPQNHISKKGTEIYNKIRNHFLAQEAMSKLSPSQLTRETNSLYSELLERSTLICTTDKDRLRVAVAMDIARWISLRLFLVNLGMTPDLLRELLTDSMRDSWLRMAERAGNLNLREPFPNPPADWDKTEKEALDFYRLATLRNGPLAKNTLNAARESHSDTAVLIAGGFHTPGLETILRRAGAMHQALCPKFNRGVLHSNLRKESLFMSSVGKDELLKELSVGVPGPLNPKKEKFTRFKSLFDFSQKLIFFGFALLLIGSMVSAAPADMGNVMQSGLSFQTTLEAGSDLLPSALSLIFGYIRIPKEIFKKSGQSEPSIEEMIDRSEKKISRLLNNGDTYEQALDILISLHSSDPDDEMAVAIFNKLTEPKKKIYMDRALEDPRWAMELAHVIRGTSKQERNSISREAFRLLPQAIRDLDDINSVIGDLYSPNFNGKSSELIRSDFSKLLERYLERLNSPILRLLNGDAMVTPAMAKDAALISETKGVFQTYKMKSDANRRSYPRSDKPLSDSERGDFLIELRKMRGILNGEIDFLESTTAMRPQDNAFPSNLGLGLEKGVGFGLLVKWGQFYSDATLPLGAMKTRQLIDNIERAWLSLNEIDNLSMEGEIEANRYIGKETIPVSSTLQQPEFSNALEEAKTRIKEGTAPVVVALPWAQAKEDFLSEIEKTSQTPSGVESLGGQQVVRFHAGALFSDTATAEQRMNRLLEEIAQGVPTIIAIDLDELVSDLALLRSNEFGSKKLQENFLNRTLAEWERLPNKPTLLFLTSEDNHSFYLPEKVTQQALRVDPSRDSVQLSLLETLEGIKQAHPSLQIETGVVPYILSQIYGESSLTFPDAQRILAWVAAQKAAQATQKMTVADLRSEIEHLPLIDKLPIARRIRAVAGKVTPEFREQIFKIANELRRARASNDEKEASRKEQLLDTLLGLFFFWKNSASQRPEDRIRVEKTMREQAKIRFKKKYSGLDYIFDQLYDLCVLPKLGSDRPAKAPANDIPLLVGPPGVGKTSLGHALAEMFGHDEQGDPFYKFAEISLAGESDGSKITGFSSTYAKSTTGAPLQLLRQAGTNKVVLLIDEIDKAPKALIEAVTRLLDQNNPFIDNYLTSLFPIDTKDIQIVLTANSLEFLKDHPQIGDRVKIIHVPDYQPDDLVQIATRHLLPQVMEEESLESYLTVPDPATFVERMLNDYPSLRSPRSIKKTIRSVLCDAFDRQARSGKSDPFATKTIVTPDDFVTTLGPPQPHPPSGLLSRGPGEVAMLASGFDDIFTVRAERVSGPPPKGLVNQTVGNIEGEMELSAPTAVRIANKRSRTNLNWELHTSHPDVKKSGNSAGLAMGLAVVSEQEGLSVRPGFAVTGALKANGEVTEVAGLEEKIPSGLHHGVHSFLLPSQNMPGLLDMMAYNPSLSGIILRKANGGLIESLVFPQEVPELLPGDPIMDPEDWESLFKAPRAEVRLIESKFAGIKGWQVEGTPEAIAQWLNKRPALVPLSNAPVYFLCSTIDEAIDFSLADPSTGVESKEDYLNRLGVKHQNQRTLPPPKEKRGTQQLKPRKQDEGKSVSAEYQPSRVPPTIPPRGRDPLQLTGMTPTLVRDSISRQENYLTMLTHLIKRATELNALEGLRACNALMIACQDLISTIQRKRKYSPQREAFNQQYDIQLNRGLQQLEIFKTHSRDIDQKYSPGADGIVKETIRSFLDPVSGIGRLINELTKVSADPTQPNLFRKRLMEQWSERYFFGREDLSQSELGFSLLALRGALEVQDGIDEGILQERPPPMRNPSKSPPDSIDDAARLVTPYLTVARGGILTFTVEEEAKPFLLDSLATAAQSVTSETRPIRFLEINFSAPSLSPTNENASISELLHVINQARAAGGTGLVVDLDRLFETYGDRTAGVLGKIVQIAQTLQPGTKTVRSFLPLPLVFVGKEQAYYRASDICPEFDTLALVTSVEPELAVLIRRTADSLAHHKNLIFSNDAINFAIQQVKRSGYDVALEAMKGALGQAIGRGEGIVSASLIQQSFKTSEERITRLNTGYSLSWIKERIQLIKDESIKRLVKTFYSQLVSTSKTDSNYVTLYSYLEAVARFPWEQVNAPLSDPEDFNALLNRMTYAEGKFNETHFGMDEVQRIIRHTLQSNWRRLNHGLPPRGQQYSFWGSPGTGKTTAVPAMSEAITYNGPKGFMTPYGSWDIDMAGMDDPSNLLGFLKTYVGARWGSLYGGIIERGLYSIFGIDEPSRAKTSLKGNPTDALTRFLDPAFRDKFSDTFVGFAVPLGPLMVILLTNDRLPAHIEDRTTLVVIPDPTPEQLAQIGQRHTLTKVRNKYGIKPSLITIDGPAMNAIVTKYVPHGARDLQRVISLLGATAANEALLKGEDAQPTHVTLDNLERLLGSPPRSTARNLSEKEPLPGEVMTFIQGVPSMVQAVHFPRQDTQQLYPTLSPIFDNPMKESAGTAFNLAVANNPSDKTGEMFIDASSSQEFKGASSGLAYYMATRSAITDQPVPKGVAYLGGIDSRGRVLKVSDKILSASVSNAAKFGLKTLVLPEENKTDLETLFFQQPRLAGRIRVNQTDTLRVPFRDAGPRPDWAPAEVIALWEVERRQSTTWNEALNSKTLRNKIRDLGLSISENEKGVQISGSRMELDKLLEEYADFTPPLTFELIRNVDKPSPPSSTLKGISKMAASVIGAMALTLIAGNLINLAFTFTAEAATVTAAASSAAWAVPLGVSFFFFYMVTRKPKTVKKIPFSPLLSDLLRIGNTSPNPTYSGLVSEYAKSGEMTPSTRAGIYGFLNPPLNDSDLDPEFLEEVKLANERTMARMKGGRGSVLPNTGSFLDFVGIGTGAEGAPPPVMTFDWASLQEGKTKLFLDGIAKGKLSDSTLAFVAAYKGPTNLEMNNYVETHWPGLTNRHRLVFVDSNQIEKENLKEGNKVHEEKMANFISKQTFNGSQISLRVLVSAEHRDHWAGLALDVFPIATAYSVENLLGAFRNTHLIFNIQA